jgi:hypothetical protein
VFIAIAMILGDGLYNFLKVLSRTIIGLSHQFQQKDVSSDLPTANHSSQVSSQVSYDDKRRTQLFLKDKIPSWFAIGGYVAIAAHLCGHSSTYLSRTQMVLHIGHLHICTRIGFL